MNKAQEIFLSHMKNDKNYKEIINFIEKEASLGNFSIDIPTIDIENISEIIKALELEDFNVDTSLLRLKSIQVRL